MNVGKPSLVNHCLGPLGSNACLGSSFCRSDVFLPPSSSHMTCCAHPPEAPRLPHILPCMVCAWHGLSFSQHSLSCIVLLKEVLVCKTYLSLPFSKARGFFHVFLSAPAERS